MLDNDIRNHVFGSKVSSEHLPDNTFPIGEMNPSVAFEIINEILLLEGNSRSNLATFCQTYMEKEAINLMTNSMSKNAIDKSEYPQVTALEQKCINMLANLWHTEENFIGTSTIGSSEACMLAGLAMKKRFENYKKEKNIQINKKPNLIISSANQVCWEKFSVYFDVELKIVDIIEKDARLDCKRAVELIDENTIGVVAILGITYTGHYDDIEYLDQLIEQYNENNEFKVFIHVDAASGGLYAPFIQPEIDWDFALNNVVSINTSGHKYGLVYPGIGWILFKDKKYVDDSLVFNVSYLGGTVPSMSLNFSHSAANIVAQYYNFIRLGFEGYKDVHAKTYEVAKVIASALKEEISLELINEGTSLPLVCYTLSQTHSKNWNLYDLSDQMLQHGWQIPTYPLSEGLSDIIIQRVVCRADLSMEMADVLINDYKTSINFLNQKNVTLHNEDNFKYGFVH